MFNLGLIDVSDMHDCLWCWKLWRYVFCPIIWE